MAPVAILKKMSNGHISATGRPIHFMFGYRVGFSGTANLMALFSIRVNSRWRPPPSWIISNAISLQRLAIYLHSAHRAVIFAIAQLCCFYCDSYLAIIRYDSLLKYSVTIAYQRSYTFQMHNINRHSRKQIQLLIEAA